jgi:FkbM family methyltransferase
MMHDENLRRKHTSPSLRSVIRDKAYRSLTALIGDKDKMVTLPVLSGPAKGILIRADLIKRRDAYFWGKYDRHILDQVLPLLEPGWTVWDCGAYLGFYSLFFARKVGRAGRVVAIDIDSRNLGRVMENSVLNKFSNIDFVNIAIGAPSGEVQYIMDEGTNSHLPGNYVGGWEMQERWRESDSKRRRGRIECISLDQAILEKKLPEPKLVKLDIEGAEKVALEHAEYFFEKIRPILLLELHNPECDHAAWDFSTRFSYDLKSTDTGKIISRSENVHGTLLCTPR